MISENLNFLDFIEETENGRIQVIKSSTERVMKVLRDSTEVSKNNTLLKIPFVSVHDYLFFLRSISSELKQIDKNALIYAAAV